MHVWFGDAEIKKYITFILSVLNNKKGWNFGLPWILTENEEESNWKIFLKQPSEIKRSGGSENLSVTFMGKFPRVTYFNFKNWFEVPIKLKDYTLKDYRTYLVLHEFGHALCNYNGHPNNSKTLLAPIMSQQTKGLRNGQKKNIWPLKYEKARCENVNNVNF